MKEFLKSKTAMWIGGGLLLLLVLYLLFRDEVDSKLMTVTGYEYDTDPESLNTAKVLKKGSRGGEVSELQRRLKQDGADLGEYGPAKDGVDGVFGSVTETALMSVKGVNAISLDQYGTGQAEASNAAVKPSGAPSKEVKAEEFTG